jgi:hypothetical protein
MSKTIKLKFPYDSSLPETGRRFGKARRTVINYGFSECTFNKNNGKEPIFHCLKCSLDLYFDFNVSGNIVIPGKSEYFGLLSAGQSLRLPENQAATGHDALARGSRHTAEVGKCLNYKFLIYWSAGGGCHKYDH